MTHKAPVCCINGAVHRERPAWAPRRDRPLARRSSAGGAGLTARAGAPHPLI